MTMNLRKRASMPGLPAPCPMRSGERLVGLGSRCWMAGHSTSETDSLDFVWNIYAHELGQGRAKVAIDELSCWVRTIRTFAGRPIETLPTQALGFCRDECIAISMVAASQHRVCPALRACTFALIGNGDIDDLMTATDQFALTLDALDRRLSAASICCAPALVTGPAGTRH